MEMFASLESKLSSLIQPIDFVDVKAVERIIDEIAYAVAKKINLKTDLEVYLLDVLYLTEKKNNVYLKPLIPGNKFGGRLHGGRPDAKMTMLRSNHGPEYPQRGIWSWAYAANNDSNIWINDIQTKKLIKREAPQEASLNTLEGGYLMISEKVINECDKSILPNEIIVFGKTTSILVIPLLYKNSGRYINVGLLSIETKKGNFDRSIFDSLVKLSNSLASLLWRLNANIHLRKGTSKAIDDFSNQVRLLGEKDEKIQSKKKKSEESTEIENMISEISVDNNDSDEKGSQELIKIKKRWRKKLSLGHIAEVLTEINNYLNDNDDMKNLNIAIVLTSEYNEFRVNKASGTLRLTEKTLQLNKIVSSLLELIGIIE